MIAALAKSGGIRPARDVRARSDPAGEPRPAARQGGLSRARELPAGAAAPRSPSASPSFEAARDRARPTARCWKPAASTSCRCSKAWRCRTTSRPPPIRKARPAGSTCSPASSPTATRGFDRIDAGYHGPLYAEISPKTFPVLVREGSRLSQIRFRRGHALLDGDGACARCTTRERLIDDAEADVGDGIAVGVDLAGLGPNELRRLSRQAPHRPDRRRAARRLRRRRFLGADRGARRQAA